MSKLNTALQNRFGITISASLIVECFGRKEIPIEMKSLIDDIDAFRTQTVE